MNQWCTGCKLSAVCLSTDYITAFRDAFKIAACKRGLPGVGVEVMGRKVDVRKKYKEAYVEVAASLPAFCENTKPAFRVQVTQRGGASYKVFQAELHFGGKW